MSGIENGKHAIADLVVSLLLKWPTKNRNEVSSLISRSLTIHSLDSRFVFVVKMIVLATNWIANKLDGLVVTWLGTHRA